MQIIDNITAALNKSPVASLKEHFLCPLASLLKRLRAGGTSHIKILAHRYPHAIEGKSNGIVIKIIWTLFLSEMSLNDAVGLWNR